MAVSGTDTKGTCFWCFKAVKWLPVLFIITIVAWSYYAYVVQLCLNIGRVPQYFKIPDVDFEAYLHHKDSSEMQNRILQNCVKNLPVRNITVGGSVRFCEKCKMIKPDRTHHCSVCGECVLKMDHHCPWINNCVCFTNYKFFVLFLGYALFYCIYICLSSLPYFIAFWKGDLQGMGRFHILFLFFVAIMFGVSLMSLFGYHCYLVLENRTTLEAFTSPSFRGVGADKYGFHLGRFKNFKEVFGENPKSWFVPVATSLGDGIQYPMHTRHLPSLYHSTDPRQNSQSDLETENSKLNPGHTEISIL